MTAGTAYPGLGVALGRVGIRYPGPERSGISRLDIDTIHIWRRVSDQLVIGKCPNLKILRVSCT